MRIDILPFHPANLPTNCQGLRIYSIAISSIILAMSYEQYMREDGLSLVEALERVLNVYEDRECLGYRNEEGYEWISFGRVLKEARRIAKVLVPHSSARSSKSAGETKNAGDVVIGICGSNDPMWVLHDFAACLRRCATVGIHPGWKKATLNRVFQETRIGVLVIEASFYQDVLRRLSDKIVKYLDRIIVYDARSSSSSVTASAAIQSC